MKERPILFRGEMVRAILEGRKTQTRRLVKLDGFEGDPLYETRDAVIHEVVSLCPYGTVGDKLWVREAHTWVTLAEKDPWKDRSIVDGTFRRTDKDDPVKMCYKADGYEIGAPWRSPIHMPRWACRIWLEITGVRVERVSCMTRPDAIDEGIRCVHFQGVPWFYSTASGGPSFETAQEAFAQLWDSINAKRGYPWESNPWVWVIEFKSVAERLTTK